MSYIAILPSGIKLYYDHNEFGDTRYFREVHKNGDEIWWDRCNLNDKHRLDGPAEIFKGVKYWYFKGKRLNCKSQEEFERLLGLKSFW